MQWDQAAILAFARDRFGDSSPIEIAIRGNKEMSELLSALKNLEYNEENRRDIAMECADIVIFMMQICEKMDQDLLFLVDEKMDINMKRKWAKGKDGSYQHV